jgi:hypothetical protein
VPPTHLEIRTSVQYLYVFGVNENSMTLQLNSRNIVRGSSKE